jgi:hypothetical protein
MAGIANSAVEVVAGVGGRIEGPRSVACLGCFVRQTASSELCMCFKGRGAWYVRMLCQIPAIKFVETGARVLLGLEFHEPAEHFVECSGRSGLGGLKSFHSVRLSGAACRHFGACCRGAVGAIEFGVNCSGCAPHLSGLDRDRGLTQSRGT